MASPPPDTAEAIADLRRLAAELDTRPGDAERRVGRMLRALLASPTAEEFHADASLGLVYGWRTAATRLCQREALLQMAERRFPGLSAHKAARRTVAAVRHYQHTAWPRDQRANRPADGDASEAFTILSLRDRLPSPDTLRRHIKGLSGSNTTPTDYPPKSSRSTSKERPQVALLAKIRNGGTDVASVPRLQDDPDYAAAVALASAISQRINRLGRERDRVTLEQRYAGRPVAEIDNGDQLFQRLLRLRKEPPLAPSAQTNTEAATPAIGRALEILAGTPVAPTPNFQERIEEIDREIGQLGDAARDQAEIVNRIAGELSFAACSAAQARWNGLQARLYQDALALSRTMASIHSLEIEIISAGATFRGDVLRMPDALGPRLIGSESAFDSEISRMRRTLSGWGVI